MSRRPPCRLPGRWRCSLEWQSWSLTARSSLSLHSPILLALPGARILQIDSAGQIDEVDYNTADVVALTRAFLSDPESFIRHF
ncbi:hypothetical protein Ae717Ps2_6640 [Pseudonocardia sp. Ae717_Ps2]|nr:hypothetical protein Ae717Ps2_6640 [Pseudonocardia sp. Ae717_Ps2]